MARLLSGSATLSGLAHSSAGVTGGISDGNHLEANANVADNDFLRVDGTEIEGRSASETLSDIGAAAIGANSDITSITGLTTDLAVAHGGTGASTLTANYALLGNGTSAPQMIAPSSDGNVLTSTGSTWGSEAIPAASIPQFHVVATRVVSIVPSGTYSTDQGTFAAVNSSELIHTHRTQHSSNVLIFAVCSKWIWSQEQLYWGVAKSDAVSTNLLSQYMIDARPADTPRMAYSEYSCVVSGSADSDITYTWVHRNQGGPGVGSSTCYTNYSSAAGHVYFKLTEIQYV